MGKQARKNRRQVASDPETAPNRRLQLGIAALVACVLVAGLAIGAVVFASGFSTAGSSALPAGTQTFAEGNHSHVSGLVSYDRVPPAGARTARFR